MPINQHAHAHILCHLGILTPPQKIISHGFNYWNDRYDTLKEKCPA
jgi:hypothetical protein